MKTILYYTFIEQIRSKTFTSGIIVIALASLLSTLLSSINYNFGDFYLATITFNMNLCELLILSFAVFLPVIHMNIEKEKGTAIVLIGKIRNPASYYIGKYLGFLAIIFSFIIISSLLIFSVALIQDAPMHIIQRIPLFIVSVFYSSSCIMALNFFIYSLLNSPVIASIITILTLYFSIFLEAAKDLATFSDNIFIKLFYATIYYLFPRTDYFNLEAEIIYGYDISINYYLLISVYALFFSASLIRMGGYIYSKKGII